MFSKQRLLSLSAVIGSFVFVLLGVGLPADAAAGNQRWIAGTQSTELNLIVADPARDRVYVSDQGRERILIIDTVTETTTELSFPGKKITDMDISKDGQKMAIAYNSQAITIFDLVNTSLLQAVPIPFAAGVNVVDVAWDYRGHVWVATDSDRGPDWVYRIDPSQGGIGGNPIVETIPSTFYEKSLLKTDAAGHYLYIGERGLSPASIYLYDVSSAAASLLAEDEHGSVGENLQDFTITETQEGQTVSTRLYVACGYPYSVGVFDGTSLVKQYEMPMEAFPTGVTASTDGLQIYGYISHLYSDAAYQFKAEDRNNPLIQKFSIERNPAAPAEANMSGLPRGVAASRGGSKLFILNGDFLHGETFAQAGVIDTGYLVAAEMRAPSGTTNDTTPTFTWTNVGDGARYDLWVNNLTTGKAQVIRQATLSAAQFTPSAPLPTGQYRAWVKAYTGKAQAAWSKAFDFSVLAPEPPARPTLTGPVSPTSERTPTISWNAVLGADKYEVWVDNQTFGQAEVIHVQNITGLSYTSGSALNCADYRVWVRASNAFGNGAWSNYRDFKVVDGQTSRPETPTVSEPSSPTTDTTPTIAWTSAARATYYDLWVDNVSTGKSQVIRQRNLTMTSFTPASALPAGTYRVWVQARNSAGNSAWSGNRDFTIFDPNQPPAGKAALTGPADSTTDLTPTIAWDAVAGASKYEVWVNNRSTGENEVIHVLNISELSHTPGAPLYYGVYQVWVRASNAFGDGPWSSGRIFSIVDGQTIAPEVPTVTGPSSPTTDTTPTIAWTGAARAAHYDLWVDNVTTRKSQVIRQTSLRTTQYTSAISSLAAGKYRVWVRAINSAGLSAWSASYDFTIEAPPVPSVPAVAFSGTAFTWSEIPHADFYDIWVNNVTTGQQRYIREEHLTTSPYTPTAPLLLDGLNQVTYDVWIRATNGAGASAWSQALRFTVSRN